MSDVAGGDFSPAGGARVVVVMGVTGAGKTTVGGLLARRLGLPFYDADDFHPAGNLDKLSRNVALSEEDRGPWLGVLAENLRGWARGDGAVLACSALRRSYRRVLREAAPGVVFVFLTGERGLIAERLERRAAERGHVVGEFDVILEGQFRDLEIPEDALVFDVGGEPGVIVDEIVEALG